MIASSSLFFFGNTIETNSQSHLLIFLTPEDKVSVRSYFRELIEDIVRTGLLRYGVSDLSYSALSITFDDEAFTVDAAKHYRNQIEEQKSQGIVLSKQQKAMLKELSLIKPQAEEAEFPLSAKEAAAEAPVASQRFGKLNIDIESNSLNAVVEQQYKKELNKEKYLDPQRPISLLVQIPEKDSVLKQFRYDPSTYIRSIQISVVLPNTAPQELLETIQRDILSNPDIKRAYERTSESQVSVKSDHQSLLGTGDLEAWSQKLLNTNHPSIGNVLLFVCFSVLGIGAFFLVVVPLWLRIFRAKASGTENNQLVPNSQMGDLVTKVSGVRPSDFGNKHVQYVRDSLCSLSKQNFRQLRTKLTDKELAICAYILPLQKTEDLLEPARARQVFEAIEKLNASKMSSKVLSNILEKIEKSGAEIHLQTYIERVCREARTKVDERQILELIPEHRLDLVNAQKRACFFLSELKAVPKHRLTEFINSLNQLDLIRIMAILDAEDRELVTSLLPSGRQFNDLLRNYMAQPGIIQQLQKEEDSIRQHFQKLAADYFFDRTEDEIHAA